MHAAGHSSPELIPRHLIFYPIAKPSVDRRSSRPAAPRRQRPYHMALLQSILPLVTAARVMLVIFCSLCIISSLQALYSPPSHPLGELSHILVPKTHPSAFCSVVSATSTMLPAGKARDRRARLDGSDNLLRVGLGMLQKCPRKRWIRPAGIG